MGPVWLFISCSMTLAISCHSCSFAADVAHCFTSTGQPRPLLSFIFGSFETNIISIFTTNRYVKKCSSSIQCQDLNPQPLEHESPPITTRPGLPPMLFIVTASPSSSSVEVALFPLASFINWNKTFLFVFPLGRRLLKPTRRKFLYSVLDKTLEQYFFLIFCLSD